MAGYNTFMAEHLEKASTLNTFYGFDIYMSTSILHLNILKIVTFLAALLFSKTTDIQYFLLTGQNYSFVKQPTELKTKHYDGQMVLIIVSVLTSDPVNHQCCLCYVGMSVGKGVIRM